MVVVAGAVDKGKEMDRTAGEDRLNWRGRAARRGVSSNVEQRGDMHAFKEKAPPRPTRGAGLTWIYRARENTEDRSRQVEEGTKQSFANGGRKAYRLALQIKTPFQCGPDNEIIKRRNQPLPAYSRPRTKSSPLRS